MKKLRMMQAIRQMDDTELQQLIKTQFDSVGIKTFDYQVRENSNDSKKYFSCSSSYDTLETVGDVTTLLEKIGDELCADVSYESIDMCFQRFDIYFKTPKDYSAVIGTLYSAGGYFSWSWETVGFGQLSFNFKDGKIEVDNECMSRESVRYLLHAFADYIADHAYLDDGKEPPKKIALEDFDEHTFETPDWLQDQEDKLLKNMGR